MAKRIDSIPTSGIRNMFDLAAQNTDLINLSIGQPDFPVPKSVKKALCKAIEEDKTGYTPSAGIPALRKAILDKYNGSKESKGKENKQNKSRSFAEDCIITSGVSGGIMLSYSALLEEGDELIIIDPYFVIYPNMCTYLNIKPVFVAAEDDYHIDAGKLEKAVTKKTKAIMLNSPNNPSGHVMSKEELQSVVDVAKKNDLWIISDEIYSDFNYEGGFVSAGDLYDKVIVLNGFSKNMALTGLRIGLAVGPKKIIEDMTKLQQYSFVCAPSIVQHAVLENLDIDISKEIAVFKKRRDLVYETLKDHFSLVKPEGAFYYYIRLPKGITGTAFSEACLKKGVLIVPGASFSQKDDHFRICYTTDEASIKKGLKVVIDVLGEMA